MGNSLDVTSRRMISETILERVLDLKRTITRAIFNGKLVNYESALIINAPGATYCPTRLPSFVRMEGPQF